MRLALGLLALAVAWLATNGFAWLRATGATPPAGDPAALLAHFEASARPRADVDVAERYRGRLDLVDPRLALPTWHLHPRDEAVIEHRAEATCPPPPLQIPLADPALAKAYAWHAATCAGATPAALGALLARPPFVHPSGRSYAGIAAARGQSPAWIGAHAGWMHVLELASFARGDDGLDAESRALATLPAATWQALTRGDDIALTGDALVLAEHGSFGVARIRIHDRAAWEAAADRAGLALVPRASTAICARAASPDLCWEPVRVSRPRRAVLVASTAAAAVLLLGSLAALVIGYTRDRRRMHLDRVHVLRTLTHELRTPATSLRLDIEPLRAAYDALPASCQEPMLRLSDGIERLCRGLESSARFMALFEPHGATRAELVRASSFASMRVLLAELAEAWPEGVALVAASDDAPIAVDADWLGVALKNLVENAVRHGAPPVVVTWSRVGAELVVRVEDAGDTRHFSLPRAVTPFGRGDKSVGLGLGLAMVARIAELLGGRLTHAPAPTAFTLRVPAGAATEARRAS